MVCVLSIAGDQDPVMPLFDVVGKGGMLVPSHCGGTALNVGVSLSSMTISKVVVSAHSPASGVKV